MFLTYTFLQKRRSWGKFRPGSSGHQNMYTFFAIRGGWRKFRPCLEKLANRDSEFEGYEIHFHRKAGRNFAKDH